MDSRSSTSGSLDGAALMDFILSRRSVAALDAPGPSDAELAQLLAATGTVPDHGALRPFRFVVVSGEGRAAFGDALAEAALERKPELSVEALQGMRAKAFRSPTSIVLIASPKRAKVEVWEQVATAACTGYAIALAAHALGIGAVWKSVPFTRGKGMNELLSLGPTEEVLGWVHLGTSRVAPTDQRSALDIAAVATLLDGGPMRPFQP